MKVLPISLASTQRRVVFLSLTFLSFAIPFSLGQPQLLVGTLVNAALFCSAILLPTKLFVPVVMFPSLAVLSRGLIFGPLTIFLTYILPFIWLSNLTLVLVFKRLFRNYSYLTSMTLAALVKQLLLFSVAKVLVGTKVLPSVFLTTMGVNQLVTAVVGGLLAWVICQKLFKSFNEHL